MTKEFSPSKKILTQLSECGRVVDLKQRPLMIDDLHDEVYQLRRYREVEYGSNPIVGCWASKPVREILGSMMQDYYKCKYGPFTMKQCSFFNIPYDLHTFPASGTMMAVFEMPGMYSNFDSILWFVDVADTTEGWDLLEPNRHLAIVGFTGFGFKS